MNILRPDTKLIFLLELCFIIVTFLTYFDWNEIVPELGSGKYKLCAQDMRMENERTGDRGRSTPPISPQQVPLKNTEQKQQMPTVGDSSHSVNNTSDMIINANEVSYMNQICGNNPMTAHYGQCTSQLQFSAPHDKHGYNVNVNATTSTTFSTSHSVPTGYVTSVPPTLIMNSNGPMNAGSVQNYMNSGAAQIQNTDPNNINSQMNNINPMNAPSAMNYMPYWTHINSVLTENTAPPWVAQLLIGLDSRLQQIETHISNQNIKWEQIEKVLQNQTRSLQDQRSRIFNIEGQMSEMNKMKGKITLVETKVQLMNSDIEQLNRQLNEYQTSIDTFSDLCDGITKDKESTDYTIGDLIERAGSLEIEHSKLENTVVYLQCRSMRDNLIFTGIDEVELDEGEEYENVEKTLVHFLETEMNIRMPIG